MQINFPFGIRICYCTVLRVASAMLAIAHPSWLTTVGDRCQSMSLCISTGYTLLTNAEDKLSTPLSTDMHTV